MKKLIFPAVLSSVILASPMAFAQQSPDASAGANGAKAADTGMQKGDMMKSGGMMKKSKKKHHHHM